MHAPTQVCLNTIYAVYSGHDLINMDLDTNRECVVSRGFILPIIKQLQNESLAELALPVLYNICVDYGRVVYYA